MGIELEDLETSIAPAGTAGGVVIEIIFIIYGTSKNQNFETGEE